MMVIFVCFFVFLAGFIDSIAGGGGLISLPAYLMTGYPIHLMLGTNKTSSLCGTLISTFHYFKNAQIHIKSALISAGFALFGSYLGASFALLVDGKILKLIVLCLLPVVCIFISNNASSKHKKQHSAEVSELSKETHTLHPHYLVLCAILGLSVGFYDGMLGPGTGTFLIIGFHSIGFSLVNASGNAKLVNLCSNIAAFTRFLMSGSILWSLAIPAAVCGVAGNYLGSRLAIKKGERIIRPLIYVMVGIIFITFLSELLL